MQPQNNDEKKHPTESKLTFDTFRINYNVLKTQNKLRQYALMFVVALCYFVSATLGLTFAFEGTNATPIWAPTGIALAAVLLIGYGIWPAIFIGAALVNLQVLYTSGIPIFTAFPVSFITAIGNTLEAIIGGYLILRFNLNNNALESVKGVSLFIFWGATVATLISASIGTFTFCIFNSNWGIFKGMLMNWWGGDILGALIIAPVILTWSKRNFSKWKVSSYFELIMFLFLLMLSSYFIFEKKYSIEYLLIPIFLFLVFRFGQFETSLGILITSGLAIWENYSISLREGLIPGGSILIFQIFIGVIAITFLILSAILAERKRAEVALKESEVHYRYLFEQNPLPMLVYELSSLNMLAVNDAFISHYGYNKQEALALKLTDLYPDSEKKAIANLTLELKGHAYVGEWHHLKKDGTLISIEAHSHEFSYEGRPSRIAVITDITERKEAEAKLLQSEEQFRLISENVADMIVVLDLEGKRVYSNPSYKPILGNTESLPGTDSFRDIHPEDREKIKNAFQDTIKTGVGERAEYRLIATDGSIHFIESQGSVIRDERGKIINVVVVSRDITSRKLTDEELKKYREKLEVLVKERTTELEIAKELAESANEELHKEIETRKQTENALKASEQRLESILNHAPILVYINDLEGRYIFVNREFEKLMGLAFAEIVNKTDAELFPKERAQRNITQNEKVISTKTAQIFENLSQKKDGEHYFVDILFPIFNSSNEIYATCGWSLDITERKKSEQILKDAKDRAESADRMKSAFLATMSHELRTPLNSIIGFTGILMKGIAGTLNAEQLKQLGMAKGSAQHLLELINDVLDISKIEAGQLVVSLSKFNFNETLRKVVSTVQPFAEKKDLKLQLTFDSEAIEIYSDERRVGQIFLNLINNAIKFTDKGFIKVNCESTDGNLVTRVIDSGIGIKKDDMDKLFKPFSQIDTGLTRNHDGTGLGLSISQKLVEKLNGTITVESEVGVGSIFTVILPL